MLADTPSPRGSGATLASVDTLSEGFERSVASPLYLVGYVRWDARSDCLIGSSFPCQTINPTAFTGRSQALIPVIAHGILFQVDRRVHVAVVRGLAHRTGPLPRAQRQDFH